MNPDAAPDPELSSSPERDPSAPARRAGEGNPAPSVAHGSGTPAADAETGPRDELRTEKRMTGGLPQSSPHTPCAEIGTRSVPSTILAALIDLPVPRQIQHGRHQRMDMDVPSEIGTRYDTERTTA